MVSIAAFQAVDPGSIPGRRNVFYIFFWPPKPASYAVSQLNIALKDSKRQKFSVTGN